MASARTKLNSLKKLAAKFSESAHPRHPKGHPMGGQFMPKSGGYTDISAEIPIQMWGGADGIKKGRKTTTLLELSAIAADDTGILDSVQLKRLISVRNYEFDSFEDFLASPPSQTYMQILFNGQRIKASVSDQGSVMFSIDNSFSFNENRDRVKPSRELMEMQQIFDIYLKSPASDRLLSCKPTFDLPDRFAARVKHYKKNGFVPISDFPGLPKHVRQKFDTAYPIDTSYPMVRDNRSNPQTFERVDDFPEVSIKGRQYKMTRQDDKEVKEY